MTHLKLQKLQKSDTHQHIAEISMCCRVISPFCNFCSLRLYLQCYYIAVAVMWYWVRSTWSPQFLRCSRSPASPEHFGTKVVIAT